jgi:hypothetical protein
MKGTETPAAGRTFWFQRNEGASPMNSLIYLVGLVVVVIFIVNVVT